jgi:hypothetical protein
MSDKGKIKFKYIYPDNYQPAYASGAFGGVSSGGNIFINFYLEQPSLPEQVVQAVNDDGSLGEAVEKKPGDLKSTLVRTLQSGVILSLDEAENLLNWLSRRITEASEIRTQLESLKRDQE